MENILQAETDEKKETVLKIIGLTYCYFPPVIDDETDELDYKEYNDRVYIDGVITFDKMREIIKYLNYTRCEDTLQG